MTNNIKRHRGAKRKAPNSAIMKLLYDNDLSTYYFAKTGILNPGTIYNASKRDVRHLSLNFFLKLSKALNMKYYIVIDKLLKLQKQYPPKYTKDHRKNN